MRIISAIFVWVILLGGLGLYMKLRPDPTPAVALRPTEAAGIFSLEVVLTFDAEPDPFAIEREDRPSLEIQFEGESWLKRTDQIAAGSVIVIDDLQGIKSGQNELYLAVSPVDADFDQVRGVRIRLLRDDAVIAEAALWSEPGHLVEGPMLFEVPPF